MVDIVVRDLQNMRRDRKLAEEKKARRFEPVKETAIAKIFEENGSIKDPHKPAYVLANRWGLDSSRESVFNPGFSLAAGDWVRIGYDPKPLDRWRVLALYDGDLSLDGQRNYNTHSTSSSSPVPSTAINIFRTTGDGSSLTVRVQPLVYRFNDAYKKFNGKNVDLTSYVPGSGLTRLVLIYLDMASGSLVVSSGSTVATGSQPPYPTLPDDSIPSAFVQLTNGQTDVDTGDDVTDARPFLGEVNNYTTMPSATEQGQILIADESLQWIAAKPVVDSGGDIVTSGGEIVYTT